MSLLVVAVALLFNLTYCLEENGLVSVAVVFRHGDRTPVSTYPKDPYKNASFWPVGFGQLTNMGKTQEYELGQWLRNRYKNFLPERYSEKDVFVRSTDVDRTLMSAQANLAGLYPPSGNQSWNAYIHWQPIPVHTTPKKLDNILSMGKQCDMYDYIYQKLLKSPEFMKIQKRNQQLYSYLSRNTGDTITTLERLEFLYNTLIIESWNNLTLPDWTKSVFPDKLRPWAEFSFALPCYTPDLARLKSGPLINNIMERFENATLKKKTRKLFMYSSHDTTVANVLNTLNVFQYHSPPYAAAVIVELHRNDSSYFINILYKNSSIPQQMTLKGCPYNCPFATFQKIVASIRVTPQEWEAECKIKFMGVVSVETLEKAVFGSCVVLVLLASCFSISIACKKSRSEKHNYFRIPNEEA